VKRAWTRLRSGAARVVNAVLRPFGVEIRIRPGRFRRGTLRGALEQGAGAGLAPRTVIDVGVATGTSALYDAFPDARLVLVEPVAECGPALARIASRFSAVEVVPAAAGRVPGRATINVHADPARSSLYHVPGAEPPELERREVTVVTLDQIRHERALRGPFLIKIDVEGAELDVLAGAPGMLAETDYLVVEVSLFDFYTGGSRVQDVVRFLDQHDLVLYDVLDVQYRPLDQALGQADLVFVRRNGPLRQAHTFHPPRPA